MPAESTAEDLGDRAKTAVEALTLTGVTVTKRKTPSLPEGKSPPAVVITVVQVKWERLTATEKVNTFAVTATVITGGGAKAADDATVRKWLKQIESVLEAQATFIAVPGFDGIDIRPGPPFDPAALAKDFNYGFVSADVTVVEGHADAA